MRVVLIVLFAMSCATGHRFEVSRVQTSSGAKSKLRAMHWAVTLEGTEWHRLRLPQPQGVTEVTMRIVLTRGEAKGVCTQRTILKGRRPRWHFRHCTDPRALQIINETLRRLK